MKASEKEIEEFKNDPLIRLITGLLGTTPEEVVEEAKKEEKSRTEEIKPAPVKEADPEPNDEDDEIMEKIKTFFDRIVKNNQTTATVENGQPHYNIKTDKEYDEPENRDDLLESADEQTTSFSMTKEELKEFIEDYKKVDNAVRKIEHTYGIDLTANENSICLQYNLIIWNLIDKIFGSDNRDDIADFVFGDSNFDTVEDLYEELV